MFGKDSVGKVQVEKEGLYYHIRCRCRIAGDIMNRLEVKCEHGKTDLGVLIPMDGGFGLDTRISISRIGQGKMEFQVLPKHDKMQERIFVPISPEEPFRYLSKLKDARLDIRGGEKGISIPAK